MTDVGVQRDRSNDLSQEKKGKRVGHLDHVLRPLREVFHLMLKSVSPLESRKVIADLRLSRSMSGREQSIVCLSTGVADA